MNGDADSLDVFQDRTTDFNFKLILVGNSRVGKTSVIKRYINDEFDDAEESSQVVQIQHKLFTIPNSVPS